MKKIALHWQIIIGMVIGIVLGLLASIYGFGDFVKDWVKPFGTIFINLLQLVAIPLVIISVINGITGLKDMNQLSILGSRTIILYLFTTVMAVSLGLLIVNIVRPGDDFPQSNQSDIQSQFEDAARQKKGVAEAIKDESPLKPLVDIFPGNIFLSMTSNRNMLQIIVFAILFSISVVMLPTKRVQPVVDLFGVLNDIIIQVVNLIMLIAPLGVLGLLAGVICDFSSDDPSKTLDILVTLGRYAFCVLLGLAILTLVFYPLLIKLNTSFNYRKFMKGMLPAQMMAFSTSSSAATLPVTMKQVEEELGVSEETASFILPLGATINMDGTSLYQGVAAIFIAQIYGMDLSFVEQLGIIFTATLASIGTAAVPSAGIIMLIIVLEQAGIPPAGIAFILAPDRLLDMFRTVTNVTGDASISIIVESKIKKLRSKQVQS